MKQSRISNNLKNNYQYQDHRYYKVNESSAFANKKDSDIWIEFKKGNRAALIYIYNTYFEDLYSYARQFTKDIELIKDAIQDLFARLFESREHLSYTDSIKFYLFKSIKREVIYSIKRNHKLKNQLSELNGIDFEYEMSFEEALINRQISEESINKIREAANNLNPRQREIIFYHFFEGFSIKQIKELMKFNSVQATYNLLNRALNHLRSVLDSWILLYLILF